MKTPVHETTLLPDLLNEVIRARSLHGDQIHVPDGTGFPYQRTQADLARLTTDSAARNGDVTWADILTEEYAEALAESDPDKLVTELTQVAATCLRWILAVRSR